MSSRLLAALRDFINQEQDTQNKQVVELWNQPVVQRVMTGEAISDITVLSVSPYQARLSFRQNFSKFRPNDNLRLSFDAPSSGFSVPCVLEAEEGDELIVSPGFRSSFNTLTEGNGYTLDRDKVDVRFILLGVLEAARENPERLNLFAGILQGSEQPIFDPGRLEKAAQFLEGMGFNDSQTDAFQKAYAAKNYYLIQGPPGTGKTRVLAQLAKQLASEGQRVLVTAFTHRAINNALRTIGQKTMYPHVIKIGSYKYADDLSWGAWQIPNYEKLSRSPYRPSSHGVIIGATIFSLHTARLQEMQFDTVIFDEAGQVTLPLALGGLLQAEKAIFIGDHQQMAPVIVAEHTLDWVKKSIFETVFPYAPGTMLETTYRMNEAINAFPSTAFYGGKLRPDTGIKDQRLIFTQPPRQFAEILNPDLPEVFVEMEHVDKTMRSPEEAQLAAHLAAEAFFCGVPVEEMAVVAPFRAQGRLIRQYLQEIAREQDTPVLTRIVVDTVERIQGQERDLVILSLVTSDVDFAAERADFYFQPNRLNVAITRARKKRIILGSPLLFETQPQDPALLPWVHLFRKLYEESTVVREVKS
jgi:DNA replication ATP-dependent helicase Dna2